MATMDNDQDDKGAVRVKGSGSRTGWGLVATLLTLLFVLGALLAADVINFDAEGSSDEDSVRGSLDVELNEPEVDTSMDGSAEESSQLQ